MNEGLREKFHELRAHLENSSLVNQKWQEIYLDEHTVITDSLENSAAQAQFNQAHSLQNIEMKKWLVKVLTERSQHYKMNNIVELFSGSGNLTEAIMSAVKTNLKYWALESDPIACDQLQRKFPTIKVQTANLYQAQSWKQLSLAALGADCLILDPPRTGFKELSKWVEQMKELKTIIYISCSPESWKRDVLSLSQLGWRCENVEAFDLFPQTPHLEVASLWTL
jgi:23S rRNA (uracil1939-C5)-methyltransferase